MLSLVRLLQKPMFRLGGIRAKMTSTIIFAILIVLKNTMCSYGSKELYQKRTHDEECILVLACDLQQVPVRSKIECYVISKTLLITGAYYSTSNSICSMCLPPSTIKSFMVFNKDLNYYSLGRSVNTNLYVSWTHFICCKQHAIFADLAPFSPTLGCSKYELRY